MVSLITQLSLSLDRQISRETIIFLGIEGGYDILFGFQVYWASLQIRFSIISEHSFVTRTQHATIHFEAVDYRLYNSRSSLSKTFAIIVEGYLSRHVLKSFECRNNSETLLLHKTDFSKSVILATGQPSIQFSLYGTARAVFWDSRRLRRRRCFSIQELCNPSIMHCITLTNQYTEWSLQFGRPPRQETHIRDL